MPIDRSSPTPQFYRYVTEYLISSTTSAVPASFNNILKRIEIPTFQRGISWNGETVELFLSSTSMLLGTVIFGEVPGQLPVLIDGLQRFAVGTALLSVLYPQVLSPNPEYPLYADFFGPLKNFVGNFQPVFESNSNTLKTYSRNAISEQYEALLEDVLLYTKTQFENAQSAQVLADSVSALFLEKQIAIDMYHGFQSYGKLLDAFIGLNTVRLDLSVVDLIRAELVKQGSDRGWTRDDIESVENELSDLFYKNAKVNRTLIPLATLIYYDLKRDKKLFSDWDVLEPYHIRRILGFIDDTLSLSQSLRNPYLYSIANTGALPLAICIVYYLILQLGNAVDFQEDLPSPFEGNDSGTNRDLATFLRACIRRLLNGDVGRISSVGESLLKGSTPLDNLTQVAGLVAPFGAGPLDSPPQTSWLLSRLRSCGKETAKSVFNAYLLPLRDGDSLDYSPAVYGGKNTEFQIDHIIPKVTGRLDQSNDRNIDLIVNFAPLIGQDNKSAQHVDASQKLAATGLYATTTRAHHAYIKWLSRTQAVYSSKLDNLFLLSEQRDPAIGDERISHLAEVLRDRL